MKTAKGNFQDEQIKKFINKNINLLSINVRKKICKNLYHYFHIDFKNTQNGLYIEFTHLNNETLEYIYKIINYYLNSKS